MKIVVDLDGTLSKVNTFRRWTLFAFLLPNKVNKTRYVGSILIFISLYFLRLLNVLTHWQMKRCFVIYWGIMQKDSLKSSIELFNYEFAQSIVKKKLNPKVLETLKNITTNQKISSIFLATAAPRFYAQHIADMCRMECIASNIIEESLQIDPFVKWDENIQKNKYHKVKEKLLGEDFIIFTDHEDDWLLIKEAKQVYLVCPNKLLEKQVKLIKRIILF